MSKSYVTEPLADAPGVGSSALLACPFCGRPAKAWRPYASNIIWKIGCDSTGCAVNPQVSGLYEKSVHEWNRRQANAELSGTDKTL